MTMDMKMGLRFGKGSKDCVKADESMSESMGESMGTFHFDSLYAMSQNKTSLLTHCMQ